MHKKQSLNRVHGGVGFAMVDVEYSFGKIADADYRCSASII